MLSGELLGKQLITSEDHSELTYTMHTAVKRATMLVELVLNKVELNADNYHTFIKVLEQDSSNYKDVLELLKDTYDSFTGGSSEKPEEGFMTWLSKSGINEKDCKTLQGMYSPLPT